MAGVSNLFAGEGRITGARCPGRDWGCAVGGCCWGGGRAAAAHPQDTAFVLEIGAPCSTSGTLHPVGLGAGQGCPRPLQFHATAGITCPLCHICQALITGMFHWTGFPASSCTCRQQIMVFAVRGMAFALLWGNLEVLTAPWVVKVGSPSWSPGWGKAHKSQACHTKITFPQAQMSHNSGFLPGCYPHWCPQQAKAFLHKQVAQGIQSPPELCH